MKWVSPWPCPMPSKNISTSTQGFYELCCEATPSGIHVDDMTISEYKKSQYFTNVQRAFSTDFPWKYSEIRSACASCLVKEEQGAVSKRMHEVKRYENGIDENFLELKIIGNICNYACVMCSPYSSSLIAEEEGVYYPRYFDMSKEWWDDFDNVVFEYNQIRFSGGEPFMSPTFKKIIKRLIDIGHTDVDIKIHTNGSTTKKVIQRIIDNFQSVSLNVSIDAWGVKNEIIRKHSNWDETEDRLWDFGALAYKNSNFRLAFTTCIQILNVGYIHEFDPFIKSFGSKNINFTLSNTLKDPDYLNAYYLPKEIKQKYLENLPKENYQSKDTLINLLETECNEDVFSSHLARLSLKIPNWREYWPEFLPYE
tara:strand:+ start:6971 stop:8071 length:1101 start_codon:yes stop_codon:yes gene_type:complete